MENLGGGLSFDRGVWILIFNDKLVGTFLDIPGLQLQGQRPNQASEGATRERIGHYKFLKPWPP
jgi:hypothetical protein